MERWIILDGKGHQIDMLDERPTDEQLQWEADYHGSVMVVKVAEMWTVSARRAERDQRELDIPTVAERNPGLAGRKG